MNHCYICDQSVDRAPADGKQHFHDECRKKRRDELISDRIVICTRTASGRSTPICEHDWQPTLSPRYRVCQTCGLIEAQEG